MHLIKHCGPKEANAFWEEFKDVLGEAADVTEFIQL
jgi:hypothetical protein